MQICIERNGENDILMYFLAIVPNIRSSGEPENIKPQVFDDFPAVWNCGKLSAKFIFSSIKVSDMVGFLSFFKSFTRTTIRIPLKYAFY